MQGLSRRRFGGELASWMPGFPPTYVGGGRAGPIVETVPLAAFNATALVMMRSSAFNLPGTGVIMLLAQFYFPLGIVGPPAQKNMPLRFLDWD